jgi:hypothetical protein
MLLRLRLLFAAAAASAALVAACSSSSSSGSATDSGAPKGDASADSGSMTSACGHPGDKGNSLGVGQYCTGEGADAGACPSTAPVCSTIENSSEPADKQTFFCVLPCTACSPAGFCGEGASCVCNTEGCGCIPDTCSALIPDAGNPPCDGGKD